jgi:hypothetical protein
MHQRFTILFVVFAQAIYCQPRLSDSNFISTFKNEKFDLKTISGKNKVWELIAGTCNLRERTHTADEQRYLNKYIDSIKKHTDTLQRLQFASMDSDMQRRKTPHDLGYNEDSVEDIYIERLKKMVKTIDDNENLAYQLTHSYEYLSYRIDYKFMSSKVDLIAGLKDSFLCTKGGFGTYCPPDGCGWKIIYKNRDTLTFVKDKKALLNFIEPINNPSKAFLLTLAEDIGDSRGFPVDSVKMQYQKINNKYYFIQDRRLSDCPVTNYKCLFEVSPNGEVKVVDKTLTYQGKVCI